MRVIAILKSNQLESLFLSETGVLKSVSLKTATKQATKAKLTDINNATVAPPESLMVCLKFSSAVRITSHIWQSSWLHSWPASSTKTIGESTTKKVETITNNFAKNFLNFIFVTLIHTYITYKRLEEQLKRLTKKKKSHTNMVLYLFFIFVFSISILINFVAFNCFIFALRNISRRHMGLSLLMAPNNCEFSCFKIDVTICV